MSFYDNFMKRNLCDRLTEKWAWFSNSLYGRIHAVVERKAIAVHVISEHREVPLINKAR